MKGPGTFLILYQGREFIDETGLMPEKRLVDEQGVLVDKKGVLVYKGSPYLTENAIIAV